MILTSEKGVSAVEFALIAPLLFVLTFGSIEFALLLFDKAVITNASREGARAAIVYNAEVPDDYAPIREIVKSYANNYLVNLGVAGANFLSDADIVIIPETPELAGDITVTVNYSYDFLVLPNLAALVGGTFDGTVNLVGTTVMRKE